MKTFILCCLILLVKQTSANYAGMVLKEYEDEITKRYEEEFENYDDHHDDEFEDDDDDEAEIAELANLDQYNKDYYSVLNSKRAACSFQNRASCAVNYTGCDRVPKDIFDDSIMANLANACNKRGVCYACQTANGWVEQDCNDRFWLDAKEACECSYTAGSDNIKNCYSAAASLYSSPRIFFSPSHPTPEDSSCSNSCVQISAPTAAL